MELLLVTHAECPQPREREVIDYADPEGDTSGDYDTQVYDIVQYK